MGLLVNLSDQRQSPLEAGIDSYFDARDRAEQRRLQKQQVQGGLLEKGLVADDQGNLTRTPEAQAKLDEEAKARDPNSERSNLARNMMAKMGAAPTGTESYNDVMGVAPLYEKYQAAKDRADMTRALRAQAGSTKDQGRVDRLVKDFGTALDPNGQRAGEFGKIVGRKNAADRAGVLFDQYGLNIPAAQTRELATAVGSLLSGGSASAVSQIEELVPKSYKGDINAFLSKLTNNPRGLEQQKFIQGYKDTVERERKLANQQLAKIVKQRVSRFGELRKLDPETHDRILAESLEPLGMKPEDLDSIYNEKPSGGLLSGDADHKPAGLLTAPPAPPAATPQKVVKDGITYIKQGSQWVPQG